ncbi:MAG: DUF2281 domain-containing protein [Planctomycetota bacterium]|nr:DUF2281 domain-containing protein [Planctomycetota bacterium]
MSTIITAHFDGRVIVPDEPLSLQPGEKVRVTIERAPTVAADAHPSLLGILEGKAWISDDFDEPLDEFKEYR